MVRAEKVEVVGLKSHFDMNLRIIIPLTFVIHSCNSSKIERYNNEFEILKHFYRHEYSNKLFVSNFENEKLNEHNKFFKTILVNYTFQEQKSIEINDVFYGIIIYKSFTQNHLYLILFKFSEHENQLIGSFVQSFK